VADRQRLPARRRRLRQGQGRRRLDELLRAGDPGRAVRPDPRRQRLRVEKKFQLGNREIVFPALESGEIDVLAEYAATALEFVNEGAGEASTDPQATADKLAARLKDRGIAVLDFAAATDQNGFVVTKATADKYGLTKISDLAKPAP